MSNPEIITHYYNTPIYLNHFQNTGSHGGFIKLPFQHTRSLVEPNIITYPQLEKYKTTNLYIFKKSMNIGNYDAELVIEHISSTNFGGTPIYVVFLLKTDKHADWTAVDDILKAAAISPTSEKPCVVHLDKIAENAILAPENNCLTNVNGTVYVFNTPVLISEQHSFADFNVSNTLLVEQSFTVENAIECRADSFNASRDMLAGETVEGFSMASSFKNLNRKVFNNMTGGSTTSVDMGNYTLDCNPAEIDGEAKTEMVLLNDNYMFKLNESRTLYTFMSWIGLLIVLVIIVGGISTLLSALGKTVSGSAVNKATGVITGLNGYDYVYYVTSVILAIITFSSIIAIMASGGSVALVIGMILLFLVAITYVALVFIAGAKGLKAEHSFLKMLKDVGIRPLVDIINHPISKGVLSVLLLFAVIFIPVYYTRKASLRRTVGYTVGLHLAFISLVLGLFLILPMFVTNTKTGGTASTSNITQPTPNTIQNSSSGTAVTGQGSNNSSYPIGSSSAAPSSGSVVPGQGNNPNSSIGSSSTVT